MTILARHPGLRRACIAGVQLAGALVIYAAAALAWKASGNGHGRPGVAWVLLATAVVAVAIAYSRRPVERLVNWMAFGERADVYELASGLLKRLATGLEVDDVLPRLAETVARTVGSQRGEVHVWLADGNTWRQTWPLDAGQGDADVTVPVHHAGDPVGEMVAGVDEAELTPSDRRLLDQLAGPAGLALSTVRLTHALRLQAVEIEATAARIRASRERIVNARREEQERIRGRLSTRVQPHLDAARRALQSTGPLDDPSLVAAGDDVARALDELRVLARGLFPARLVDGGLVEAIRSWAEQHGLPLTLSATGDLDRLQRHPQVTAALYFCGVIALSGSTTDATVTIAVDDASASLQVHAAVDAASFQSLCDRAEAFGGTVEVGDGHQSSMRVRLPLGDEQT
jgi:signal transduction histidine kinase